MALVFHLFCFLPERESTPTSPSCTVVVKVTLLPFRTATTHCATWLKLGKLLFPNQTKRLANKRKPKQDKLLMKKKLYINPTSILKQLKRSKWIPGVICFKCLSLSRTRLKNIVFFSFFFCDNPANSRKKKQTQYLVKFFEQICYAFLNSFRFSHWLQTNFCFF